MTDVQVTIEGCDHVMSPIEALAKAKELEELAEQALQADAYRPELTIERGLITKDQIGVVVAEYCPFGSRKWKVNTTKLWSAILEVNHRGDSYDNYHRYKFTVMCFPCGTPLEKCQRRHYEQQLAVPVSELFEHQRYFRWQSVNISVHYRRLLQRVKVLTTA